VRIQLRALLVHTHTYIQHFNSCLQLNLAQPVAPLISVSSHPYPDHPQRTGQNFSYFFTHSRQFFVHPVCLVPSVSTAIYHHTTIRHQHCMRLVISFIIMFALCHIFLLGALTLFDITALFIVILTSVYYVCGLIVMVEGAIESAQHQDSSDIFYSLYACTIILQEKCRNDNK